MASPTERMSVEAVVKSALSWVVTPAEFIDSLNRHGFVIVRDPAHAPEAVEASAKSLCSRSISDDDLY